MALDGFLNFLQNVVASIVLALVSILSYAVANSFKRILTIGLSFLIFRNPVQPLNLAGICLAVGGVFIYSLLKAQESEDDNDSGSKSGEEPKENVDTEPKIEESNKANGQKEVISIIQITQMP